MSKNIEAHIGSALELAQSLENATLICPMVIELPKSGHVGLVEKRFNRQSGGDSVVGFPTVAINPYEQTEVTHSELVEKILNTQGTRFQQDTDRYFIIEPWMPIDVTWVSKESNDDKTRTKVFAPFSGQVALYSLGLEPPVFKNRYARTSDQSIQWYPKDKGLTVLQDQTKITDNSTIAEKNLELYIKHCKLTEV